ncbi:hypothetical protein OHW58_01405 [Acinetobacter baumannii]|uniref:hypothetical protein n=1 Tax=Acinetobacter baumannii TaxID=470 RepID=UPI001BA3CE38|nr:hypothetical protein [Acinetobacter baumannii]MBR8606208.1 hypothetical protein [Acinetobacter baumannii]MDC5202815.1 hypothetical protein [Acinetobacter baumannii]MDH2476523.1 hypothetical protein [Acinetobacter baumannii]MDV7403602.1 hypothetical protein [Acinetobacter baumannii]
MIDFYIKQNLEQDNLRNILKEVLNLGVDDFCLIHYEDFTPENTVYDFNKFKVICTYQFCKGDVSLLINIIDGDELDNDFIVENLKNKAKEEHLDFYLPDEDNMDMGSFVLYLSNGKLIKNLEIQEEEDNYIFFL